jgi:FAD/FMN-containing dehydrogenase
MRTIPCPSQLVLRRGRSSLDVGSQSTRQLVERSAAAGGGMVAGAVGSASFDRRELLWRGVAAAALLAGADAAPGVAAPRRLPATAVRRLDAAVRGTVAVPGRATYASARRVYQLAGPLPRPLAVVQVRDSADVQALLRWAAREDAGVVARSGGHSYIRQSGGTGAVVADLSRLRAVSLDRGSGEVEVGGGVQLIDLNRALAARGALVPSGSCPSVGIGGVTLGGGMGLSARRLGLTCDRLVAATIVTADGRRRRVDARSDEDLFWALRGGGGSFGVVTSLRFSVHRASRAAWAFMSFPWARADDALARWQALAPDAPRALTSILTLSAGSPPRVTVIAQHFGTEADLRRLLAPLARIDGARLSTGVDDLLGLARRWAGCLDGPLAACHTQGTRPGGQLDRAAFAASSIYLHSRLGDAGRRALLGRIAGRRGSGTVILDAYGGAINAVDAGATAFVHRDVLASAQILSYHAPGASAGPRAWVSATRAALARVGARGAYCNYADPTLDDPAREYWGANRARLRDVKRSVDPDRRIVFPQSAG